MITIICGAPGAGKTALMTFFATQYLRYDSDFELSVDKINHFNNDLHFNLTMPKHLIFTDFKVQQYGVETYFVNGYYLGMPNGQHPTMFLPPYSKVFLSEAQRYYDSRKYASLADFVSQLYEQHRHWGMSIYLDCQRDGLVDLNIRGISTRVIYVESMTNDIDYTGRVIANHWQVREFSCADDCDRWRSGDKTLGESRVISNSNTIINFAKPTFCDTPRFANASNFKLVKNGSSVKIPQNIFDNYNSTNKEGLFLRGRSGHDFSLYSHPTDDSYMYDQAPIYNFDAPRTFYKLPDKELQKLDLKGVLTI